MLSAPPRVFMPLRPWVEIARGKVLGRRGHGSRRIAFGDLMNGIVAASTDRKLHVILDNLSMHKPRRDQWLARDKNVNFCPVPALVGTPLRR